jgi:hypothetical protein
MTESPMAEEPGQRYTLLQEHPRQKGRGHGHPGRDQGGVGRRGEDQRQVLQPEVQDDAGEAEEQEGGLEGEPDAEAAPVGEGQEDQ